MRIKLMGRYFDFRFVFKIASGYMGWCHTPETPNKKIRVKKSLPYNDIVDTSAHEIFHCISPSTDEIYISEGATDWINALKKLGFIRTEEEWRNSPEYQNVFK